MSDSVARPIDTETYALVGDVDRYEYELLALVFLQKVGLSGCNFS